MEKREIDEPFIEKGKHRGLKLIIVILLIAGLSFGGYYYYTNYYDNPSKKVNSIITGIEEKLSSKYNNSLLINNKAIKMNGLIKLNVNLGNDLKDISEIINNLSIQINGEMDNKNKINNVNFTSKYKDGELIDMKIYTENNNIYLSAKELYDKYVFLGNTDELVNNSNNTIESNDIKTMFKSMLRAINKSLNTDKVEKTEETLKINNIEKNTNKYSLSLKDNEINNYIVSIFSLLRDDQDFINVTKKIDNNILNNLNDLIDEAKQESIKGQYTLNFYTTKKGLSEELVSIRQTFDFNGYKVNLNIDLTEEDSYLITLTSDDMELNCNITTNKNVLNVDFSSNYDDIKINMSMNFNYDEISTITKEDVSNNIAIDKLTESDFQTIANNIEKNKTLTELAQKVESIANSFSIPSMETNQDVF